MKKMLLVMTVVLVGSLAASAAPVTFNFSFDGFCDQMETTRYTPGAGFPKKFLTGIHDFSNCGIPNVAVGGFQHGNPSAIPPNVAPVNDYSDPFLGFFYGIPDSLQYLVHEPNALHPACVWANYTSNGNANYLINSGTCTRFAGAAPKGRAGNSSVKR